MTLEEELRLSYYKEITPLSKEHGVYLAKNSQDNKIYVKKTAEVYDLEVFLYLKEHPVKNMPRIFEAAEKDGKLITIEEYIPGETLREYLDKKKTLSEEETKEIAVSLCEIVKELHSASPPIIHRDIKPENIMLTPDGTVKLLDLNAAKRAERKKSSDTVLIGTAGYAAPEQYGFSSSDEKTDVYAIGAVMNIMLTGALPGQKAPEGSLGKIIEKCTKMDPAERYSDAGEVLCALESSGKKDSFALPGFRGKNPLAKIFSSIGYVLLICLVFLFESSSVNTVTLWVCRVILAAALFAVVLLAGNYRDVQKALGIKKIKNAFARVLVIVLLCVLIMIIGLLLMFAVEETALKAAG